MAALRHNFSSVCRPITLFRVPRSIAPTRLPTRRAASQYSSPGGGRRRPGPYNRFSRPQSLKKLWQTSPIFRVGISTAGAGLGVFVVYNIETVPVSGRKRFNWISPEYEREMGQRLYQHTMRQYRKKILPASHPQTQNVRRVLDRLIPASGLRDQEWEIHVIQDKTMNAFVIPG